MYLGHTDIWGHRNIQGCTDVWDIQTYRGQTDVWEMYRCLGWTDVWRPFRHGGMYGGIQMYRACTDVWDIQGHTDIWECTDVWGDVQMYGEHTDMGCTDVVVIQTTPDRQTARHTLYMPAKYTWVLYYL